RKTTVGQRHRFTAALTDSTRVNPDRRTGRPSFFCGRRRSPTRAGHAMPGEESFQGWMDRLRSGEDAAAREVFDRFAGRLIALTRGQFNRLLARKVDPED